MNPAFLFRSASIFFAFMLSPSAVVGGEWVDHFSQQVLGSDWRGDRDFFAIQNGALDGESASPLAPSALHRVEVGQDWGDYVVECRINIVEPNLRVCTKGALILRHQGNEGYVFALHEPPQRVEVYRLSNNEMLLAKPADIKFKSWYRLRAELKGSALSFFLDDQLIGTVNDAASLSGATGVAVQDAESVLFDDFAVTGPAIPSNGLEVVASGNKLKISWPNWLSNYTLKSSETLSPSAVWTLVAGSPIPDGDSMTLTLNSDVNGGSRYYRLVPN